VGSGVLSRRPEATFPIGGKDVRETSALARGFVVAAYLFYLFLPSPPGGATCFPSGVSLAAPRHRALGRLSVTLFHLFLRAAFGVPPLSFLSALGVRPLVTSFSLLDRGSTSPTNHSLRHFFTHFSSPGFGTPAASPFSSPLSSPFFLFYSLLFPWSLCSWHSPASSHNPAPFYTALLSLFPSAAFSFPRRTKTPPQPIMKGVLVCPPIMAKHTFPARGMLAQFLYAVAGGRFSPLRVFHSLPGGGRCDGRMGGIGLCR
jgi:hypothetical protein